MSEFKVGQRVEVKKYSVSRGADLDYGAFLVAKVTKLMVTLSNGSKWRTLDGYAWGSQPTRGLGRSMEQKIVPAKPHPLDA